MTIETEKVELAVQVEIDPGTGMVLVERYFLDGKLHRPGDLPAVVKYDPETGREIERSYFKSGERHRIRRPAEIHTDPHTGVVTQEIYHHTGTIHRDGDYPACILRHPTKGHITAEDYVVAGKLHRETGPATIEYDYESGKIEETGYFLNGQEVAPENLNVQNPHLTI